MNKIVLEKYLEILLFSLNILLSSTLLIRGGLITKVLSSFLLVYLVIKMVELYFAKKRRINYKTFGIFYY